jgi:hypothetical protein
MAHAILVFLITVGSLVSLTVLLHTLPRLGRPGRAAADWCTRAPGLDVVVFAMTVLPCIAGASWAGWWGLLGGFTGQLAALGVWVVGHEMVNRDAVRGPRIVSFINRSVGRWQNHAALWVTAVSVPVFWQVRLAEVLLYPFLVWLLRFPRYNQAEWVNVSRQKFKGLVGHDLIWCLYCDWMTGVYSLGAEMLRNVESFWCPIRFTSGKKCDNCKLDFPDVAGGWVPADGTMQDVERVLEERYAGGRREWFGHPARLTVRGVPAEPAKAEQGSSATEEHG